MWELRGVPRTGALTGLGRPVGLRRGAWAEQSRESHSEAWSFSCGGGEPQVPAVLAPSWQTSVSGARL